MKGQVGEKEKERRLDLVMKAQAKIAFEFNESLVGREISGIIDGPSGRDDLPLAGRTYGDAPEVDGTVYMAGGGTEGEIVTLKVTGVEGYDLLAEAAR
jgi:ribosomal protein S12 methylthiotransferase